jgi:hypothetical protein
MLPRYNRLARIVLRRIRLASSTTIVARRDTSSGNVVAYTKTRSLSLERKLQPSLEEQGLPRL